MAESGGERARWLKAARQRRWRLHREVAGPGAEVAVAPAVPAAMPGALPGALPDHMSSPMFGLLMELGLQSVEEAARYTEYVRQLPPGEALMPLRPGASPPASEARLQRAEAVRQLSAMAATPVTAARVMRDVSGKFDLAREIQAHQAGEPNRLVSSTIGEDGMLVPGPLTSGDGESERDA
jgi:hypothetical protein